MEEVAYLNISANTENKGVRQNIVFMKRNINNPDIYFLMWIKLLAYYIRLSNLGCGIT